MMCVSWSVVCSLFIICARVHCFPKEPREMRMVEGLETWCHREKEIVRRRKTERSTEDMTDRRGGERARMVKGKQGEYSKKKVQEGAEGG